MQNQHKCMYNCLVCSQSTTQWKSYWNGPVPKYMLKVISWKQTLWKSVPSLVKISKWEFITKLINKQGNFVSCTILESSIFVSIFPSPLFHAVQTANFTGNKMYLTSIYFKKYLYVWFRSKSTMCPRNSSSSINSVLKDMS